MRSSFIYGYGFNSDCDEGKLIDFIKNHKKAFCKTDGDCNTLASVVFETGYPWQLNETEKNLTEEKLKEICKTYMDKIGLIDEPDYLELEYFG